MAATLHHKYSIMLVAIASLIIIAMTLILCVLQDQGSAYKFNGTHKLIACFEQCSV